MNVLADNQIQILIKLYSNINKLFGLQKLTINSYNEIKVTGTSYKVFALLKMVFFIIMMIYSLVLNNLEIYNNMPGPLLMAVCLSHFILLFSYILIVSKNIFSKNEIYKKIIWKMSKGMKILKINTLENCKMFKKYVIMLHCLIFILKTIHILIYFFTFNNYRMILIQIVFATVDLELIHFAIEVNLVARMFEYFNKQMADGENNSYLVQNGILSIIWHTNKFQTIKVTDQNRHKFIAKYLNIYHLLASIVHDMNSYYGYLVICILILYFYNISNFTIIIFFHSHNLKVVLSTMISFCGCLSTISMVIYFRNDVSHIFFYQKQKKIYEYI